MRNRFLAGAIIAALLVPAAAQAQPKSDFRDRDRGGVMVKKPSSRPAPAPQSARYDKRNDRKTNQRVDWRQEQRYRNFRAPFAYQRFQTGSQLRPAYYGSNFRQSWDRRWGVPKAGKNQSYVRHYNDLLLINDRNGKVVRVYRDKYRRR